ncbi:DUF1295 domain-containing protein [Aurantiacibacter aquimixticola]|uniref:DUF1295 domain-containing protein n=1 Tax=Aurantiacibacter aquimixticola TaxID=1958945 RepID=A0A419RUC2_9SPHN|nr:DUF1295 domain-containing protein [Aurantiacibacter aquimixticola]RJY09379.1 DUF1295 domain-containing protein [Aurantiacibacter aquimixticola]
MTDALTVNGALLVCAVLGLWVISAAIGKASFVDSVWGFAMAGLALASFMQLTDQGSAAALLLAMVAAWGVRLGVHLLRRYWRNGEDARYRNMLPPPEDRFSFALTSLWKVWLLQAALIMLVSSPAQVGILAASDAPITAWALPGIALYLLGIFFEWVGDWQLARFKADPSNEGKVMNEGLWRYTRHPNYFGDACAWWGIWLVAASVDLSAALWTLPGPIFLTFTLVKWSGAAMTEDAMDEKYGDDFARYKRRTSAFIPMPPKEPA